MQRIFLSWLVVMALIGPTVQASGLPSMIAFSMGSDTEGSRDSYIDLDYAVVDDARLLFSLSSNKSANNRFDGQDYPTSTRSILLGFRTDPLAPFSVGADLASWGEKGSLETKTFRAVMEVGIQNWQFSLRPQWRNLIFTTDCIAIILPRCQPEVQVKSTGVAFDMSYYTDGPWSFSLGFARHQYDKKVEVLALDPRMQLIFSTATLNLSTGLEARRNSVGVSYFSDAGDLWSVSWLKSVSKVTGDASLIHTLYFSTALNEHWRLRLRLGRQTLGDGSDVVGFAGAGLAYSW